MSDVRRFGELIRGWFGLDHDDSRLDALAEVLRARLAATGARDLDTYAGRAGPEERRALATRLTVGETYFFRNPDHFRALSEHVLPERVRHNEAARQLRILSLGCATGEEPYSVAILLRERFPHLADWTLEVVGLDVNPDAIAHAERGRYGAWALRAAPADVVARWFRIDGRHHVLDPGVRAMVRFAEHNLVEPAAAWATPGRWDIVLCRNVLMYMTPEVAAHAIDRLGRALVPGGYLFLGHAETLRGRAGGFGLRHTHDTFYYQVDGTPPPEGSGAIPGALGWIDEIDRASRRIASLSARPLIVEDAAERPVPAGAAPALARARALFEQERVDDALAELDGLPEATRAHPEALLLRAVLCTNRGRLADAEAACERLLARSASDPGAHYLMALCRESAGDRDGAARHDRAAIAADAGFAMARLHLGLLHRRAGDVAAARDELARALELLARDEAARLELFGGGFRRDALEALCRAELRACGGAP